MKSNIYNQEGKAAGSIELPESVFGLKWNSDLVHQVITAMNTNARHAIAHTKTRGDVSGGGKKPWAQNGTGRARHGSTRSPIWVGGGVAHGPRNDKNFDRKINRKMKAKALFTILSRKFKDGEVLFIDDVKLSAPKSKDARTILEAVSKITGYETLLSKRNNSAYMAFGSKDMNVEKSFRNFSNVLISEARNMNPVDMMNHKFVVITKPEETIAFLSGKLEAVAKATPKKGYTKKEKAVKVKAPKVAKAPKIAKAKKA